MSRLRPMLNCILGANEDRCIGRLQYQYHIFYSYMTFYIISALDSWLFEGSQSSKSKLGIEGEIVGKR